jgi:DNA polymerase-3 subunit gamma/tau
MSYLVSARRWRPQRFEDLIGQEHISRTLANAIRAERVAHAFLFTGLRGVGKTTAARVLAKALNCEKGPAPEPCNECGNCQEITEGRSVDVLEIDGASNTGVDDVREIIENVRYQAANSRFKIYIIDEVHMLSNSAFNALLKTLEEPPPHVKFIFATTDPQKLPATVQSRCQRYDFRRIPLRQIVDRLRAIADEEKIGIGDKVLYTLAREAEGSMRDAQSLLDQITAGASGEVKDEDALAALGIADRKVILDLGEAIIERRAAGALETLDAVYRQGCDVRRLTRDLLEHFRDLAVAQVSDGALLPDGPDEDRAAVVEHAGRLALADADRAFRLLLQTDDEVNRSPYPKLVLEMALIKVATMEPLVPVGDLLCRLEELEGRTRSGGAAGGGAAGGGGRRPPPARRSAEERERPAVPVRSAAPVAAETAGSGAGATDQAASAEVPGEPQGDGSWAGFVTFVAELRPTLGVHIATCRAGEIGERKIEIEAPRGFRADYLGRRDHLNEVEELAQRFFGRNVRVAVSACDMNGAAAEPAPSSAELADGAMRDPAVRAAIDILGGELAEVRQRRR